MPPYGALAKQWDVQVGAAARARVCNRRGAVRPPVPGELGGLGGLVPGPGCPGCPQVARKTAVGPPGRVRGRARAAFVARGRGIRADGCARCEWQEVGKFIATHTKVGQYRGTFEDNFINGKRLLRLKCNHLPQVGAMRAATACTRGLVLESAC